MTKPKQTAQVRKPITVPGASPVRVDTKACERLASVLISQSIPLDKEDSSLSGFSDFEVGNFYLFLVAICHQTSPKGRPPLEGTVNGEPKRGWDYLAARLEAAVKADRSLLDPQRWSAITIAEFSAIFHDPELGDRLSEPDLRARLVQDLGQKMVSRGWCWFDDIFNLCPGVVASGDPNLFCVLAQFEAYNDPVRKKSCFLLALMRNFGLWKYVDDENVGPPVDYHEVRGHLRIGTVEVTDAGLRHKLLNGILVTAEEDILIRSAVYNVIMLLSELTELRNASQLHYLFWNVFRTHCLRDNPHCFDEARTLPDRYKHLSIFGNDHRCPFSGVCASAHCNERFSEHTFETTYY